VSTRSRYHRLCVGSVVIVLLAGCDPTGVPGPEGLDPARSLPTSGQVLAEFITVTPKTLEFVHRVGQTGCPQLVGKITIKNMDTVRRTPTVVAGANLGFQQTGASGLVNGVNVALDPSQTVEIEVYFACTTQTNFTSKVTVTTNGATSGEVEVKGTVG